MKKRTVFWLAGLVAIATIGSCARTVVFEWKTYQASSGWSVRYPAHWHFQEFNRSCTRLGGWRGVVVTNLDRPIEPEAVPEGSCSNAWEVRGLPDSTIVVEIRNEPWFGRPPAINSPLRLEWADPVIDVGPNDEPLVGAIQPRLHLAFPHDGIVFAMNAWIAGGVSTADRRGLEALVRSIGFAGDPEHPVETISPSPGPPQNPSNPRVSLCASRPGSDGGCPARREAPSG